MQSLTSTIVRISKNHYIKLRGEKGGEEGGKIPYWSVEPKRRKGKAWDSFSPSTRKFSQYSMPKGETTLRANSEEGKRLIGGEKGISPGPQGHR